MPSVQHTERRREAEAIVKEDEGGGYRFSLVALLARGQRYHDNTLPRRTSKIHQHSHR